MREGRPSLTAVGIAAVRAIETSKPADERICSDPLAREFVSTWLYLLLKFFVDIGYAEVAGAGVFGFLVARDRYIDDYLQACLDEGIEQLVLLGAGYDTRAYRFERLRQGAQVFEVDHPATQREKVGKIKTILGALPDHVVYVPIDFNTDKLDERLYASGYEKGCKTLFIWQGVTPYLTAEAIDETLAFVAGNSAPGSAIIFYYFYSSLLNGTTRHGEVKRMRRMRFVSGERLTFSIPQGSVEAFLGARGFDRIHDLPSEKLHDLYFSGKNAKRKVTGGYAIVSARVRLQPSMPE